MPTPLTPYAARTRIGQARWLDVRDPASFAEGHLPASGNVPPHEWPARRHELPARSESIVIVADDAATAADAAHRLAAAGHTHVEWLDAPWQALDAGVSREPAAPLWRPSAFLERVLPGIPRGLALDVACGAGREAVYLALNGFEVEAWDHDATALVRAEGLALRHGARVHTVAADLEDATPPPLAEGSVALLVCFRYLHRPLFPWMQAALAPGGHVVYETFRQGQERHGHPKRERFLLRNGELREAFAALDVLEYEETEPPGGPVMARLHARRP